MKTLEGTGMGIWNRFFGRKPDQASSRVPNVGDDIVNPHLAQFRIWVAALKVGDTKDGRFAARKLIDFLEITGTNETERAMERSAKIAALQKALHDEDTHVRLWANTLLRT
jgi:hypothetical protein